MKKHLLSLTMIPLFVSIVFSSITPAIAAPLVRQVSQSQAQGLKGNGASVTVWQGAGTNIDFTRTSETILRAWLDDPSKIAVDFDGSLGKRSGASIVHLKRVTGIQFPNIPRTESTLLTVITQSKYGRKTYLFQVGYGSGKPQYASIAVTPDHQNLADGGGVVVAGNRTANWNDVERGLQRALSQRLISSSSLVAKRVRAFLAQVRNGMPMQQAAQRSQLSLEVVSKLAEMGYSTTTPATLPNPSSPTPSVFPSSVTPASGWQSTPTPGGV